MSHRVSCDRASIYLPQLSVGARIGAEFVVWSGSFRLYMLTETVKSNMQLARTQLYDVHDG